MSRKLLLVLLGLGVLVVIVVGREKRYVISVERVSERVYVMVGSGMNATALITDDGVVLVDTMNNGWWGPATIAALRTVTDRPVTTIINTNSNAPHSGNNLLFPDAAGDIVAHETQEPDWQKR